MKAKASGPRGRIVVRPVIRPSAETAAMADEWQRQGKPHFISRRTFQASQHSPVKVDGGSTIWEELRKLLFGESMMEKDHE